MTRLRLKRRIRWHWAFALAVSLVVGGSTRAEELLSLFLQQPQAGEFPCEMWYPEQRPSIEKEVSSLRAVMDALTELEETQRLEIKKAYNDRSVLVRNLDAPNLRARIKNTCDAHQVVMNALKKVRWCRSANEPVTGGFAPGYHRKIETLCELVHLQALVAFSEGQVDSASQVLSAGFAFAHNVALTADDVSVNLIVGEVAKKVLVFALADLQSMGAPDMTNVLTRLDSSRLPKQGIDRALWNSVCDTLPVLLDKPRNEKQWCDDVVATLEHFKKPELAPKTPEEAELFGRQLQSIVSMGKRVSALAIPVSYEHGGLKEIKELQAGQAIRFKLTLNIPVISNYVEQMLDSSHLDRVRIEQTQLLCGATCVERIRNGAVANRGWLSVLDEKLLVSMPQDRSTGNRPIVTTQVGINGLPAYRIKFSKPPGLSQFKGPPLGPGEVIVNVESEWKQ